MIILSIEHSDVRLRRYIYVGIHPDAYWATGYAWMLERFYVTTINIPLMITSLISILILTTIHYFKRDNIDLSIELEKQKD